MASALVPRNGRPDACAQGLINALDNQRLHHAYLFTGTRGVGKTTIARIIAAPELRDGRQFHTLRAVFGLPGDRRGRFVDLIEVDAASRTKVEDTRELLDNVQYAPSRGRYKVYLIDEVHMLVALFQRAAQDPRRAAAPRQVPARDHRSAEAASDHPVALPAVLAEKHAAGASR